jgi:hypothetical protein
MMVSGAELGVVASAAQSLPDVPALGHRHVLPFAPPMPPGFYGAVRFEFQAGKLVSAVVEERLKP